MSINGETTVTAALIVPQSVFIALLSERTLQTVNIDPNAAWVDLGGILIINETVVRSFLHAARVLLGSR